MLVISRPTAIGDATISLLNLNGKNFFKQDIGKQESISIDLNHLPSGSYILLYTSDEENYRRLLLKE